MRILNLTMHSATPEQIEAGVYDLPDKELSKLKKLLTFVDLPSIDEVRERARWIAAIAHEVGAMTAMIGGAPFLMRPLHEELYRFRLGTVYAFSVRESVEKTAVFKHRGFVGRE